MTTKRRRRFTADFKKRVALEALRGDRTVQVIAAKHEVHPNQVGTWKRQAIEGLDEVFARGGSPGPSEHEATIRDLHTKIDELTMERDLFSGGCSAEPAGAAEPGRPGRRVEHQAPMRAAGHQPLISVLRAAGRERGEPGVDAADGRLVAPVPVLRQSADGAPSAARGRGGGAPSSPAPDEPDGPGGDLLQAAHERRAAGSPRLPVPVARTEDRPSGPGVVRGHHVHPGDDRLSVRSRDHGLGQPTYAVVAAVEHDGQQLLRRGAGGGATDGDVRHFNTDQGSQFTSAAFTDRVQAAGARCSMDGRGRCLDSVFIERLWRSLKYEAVYLHELADGFAAEQVISEWMTFYSDARPHSALGGCTRAAGRGTTTAGIAATTDAVTTVPAAGERGRQGTTRGVIYQPGYTLTKSATFPENRTTSVSRSLTGSSTVPVHREGGSRQRMSGPSTMSHPALWTCPACGRPLTVALNPEGGEAGAHRLWESRGRAPPPMPAHRPRDSHSSTAHHHHR